MKIVINDSRKSSKFTTIFHHLKQFSENVLLYLRPEGLYIQCMDDSHCCLFECDIRADWFNVYEFNANIDPPNIGINMNMFYKVLSARQESQSIEIEINNADPTSVDKVYINFAGSEGKFSKFFELPLVFLESELMDVKELETLVDLTMETKTFCELIQQLMIFNDVLTLTFNDENIGLNAEGNEGSMRAEIKLDDVKEYAISEKTCLKQSYSLRYIHMMCQFNKLANEIYLGFSDSMPMHMKYNLGDNSYVHFHLAPKIVDNE